MAHQARIGVLALQGDFREHLAALERAGASARPVRLAAQLEDVDGLVIPGGESTVMGKLMVEYGLLEPLRSLIAAGTPVWGTCAGLVLLSEETDNALAGQPLLATLDVRTRRNAFGPQRASFEADVRAPAVERVGPGVETLGRLEDEPQTIVAVRQGNVLATAFHPEVTSDLRFHDYFLGLARAVRV
jgi:5'-phosphate synthase pdxT subunit